jgi:uncharacterized HAD superfamily protein
MKIGIDFDDVLFDTNSSLALFHNSHYGSSYERKDVQSWFLEHIWGCTPQEAIARVKEWYQSSGHMQLMPMPGALEAIVELSRDNELYVITARPMQIEKLTLTLLEQHFPEKFSGLHFTNHFERDNQSKADVCKKLGISLLVEDALVHARTVAAADISVLLLDSPWNQEVVSANITRVFSWEEIVRFVLQKPA